jgi:hypothetical protein
VRLFRLWRGTAAEPSPPDPVTEDWAPHVAAFEESIRGTERAWHSTSLLAMSRRHLVDKAMATLRDGGGKEIGELLSTLAHESYLAAAPLTPGLDAGAAAGLSSIVTEVIAADVANHLPRPREPEQVASELLRRGRLWIETGQGDAGDLARISALVGSDAGVRAALIAPLGPVGATLRCVARAAAAGFSFRDAAPRAATAKAKG